MKKSILYTMCLAGVLGMSSCADDFLDQENSYQLSQENLSLVTLTVTVK